MLSSRFLLPLIVAAAGIPIIFGVVTNTSHVVLEEFSNALISLDWENAFKIPLDDDFDEPFDLHKHMSQFVKPPSGGQNKRKRNANNNANIINNRNGDDNVKKSHIAEGEGEEGDLPEEKGLDERIIDINNTCER